MDKQVQNELKEAYLAVFDENGYVKQCGREACIRLINLVEPYSSEEVGREDTGMINVEVMKKVYNELMAH